MKQAYDLAASAAETAKLQYEKALGAYLLAPSIPGLSDLVNVYRLYQDTVSMRQEIAFQTAWRQQRQSGT